MKPVLFCLALIASIAHALPGDRALPIQVLQADRSEWDNQAGQVSYFGNVVVVQGALRIEAEQLIVSSQEIDGRQQASLIEASGEPAYFRDQLNEGEAAIEIWGNTLTYQISPETITAIGDARVHKGCNRQASPEIIYDGQADTLTTKQVTGTVLPGLTDGSDCE